MLLFAFVLKIELFNRNKLFREFNNNNVQFLHIDMTYFHWFYNIMYIIT